jgi:superoxide dismutase, Fe-Mn family
MFTLPALPYAPDAFAPTISEMAMRTHHEKHHAKYIDTTNALLRADGRRFANLEAVIDAALDDGQTKLANNAGQAWNHAFFWWSMTPHSTAPSDLLQRAIDASFGNIEGLQRAFIVEGSNHFGSGWVWLVAQGDALAVVTTHDGQTALSGQGVPLLVCDLWEHAYYLDHLNDRGRFLSQWWRLIDWSFASERYEAALSGGRPWRFSDAEAHGLANA